MPYRNRHYMRPVASPAIHKYGREAAEGYWATPLAVDEEDEATLGILRTRGRKDGCTQAERELIDDILARKEERVDAKCAPLAREIESYFENLNLPPLPPPLPKSTLWFSSTRVHEYKPAEVRPFYVACLEGRLDEVKEWVCEKKDVLRPLGIRDGLDIAAKGDQVDVARYLLEEAGAFVSACAVEFACKNLSLGLFELFLEHGYHPNQQVPCNKGHFGTALLHCLDSEAITLLLLANGADPNVTAMMDSRRAMWSERAVVPMDRRSGLPLDLAMEKCSLAVIKKMLDCGAKPAYSRPLSRILSGRAGYIKAHGIEDDWKEAMELVMSYGADVNARSWWYGTAINAAVYKERWDVVGFLLDHGADPRVEELADKKDAFETAANRARIPWGERPGLKEYLDCLCGEGEGGEAEAPAGAGANPLVRFILERKGKKDRAGGEAAPSEE